MAQDHHKFILGGLIAFELVGAVLFIANWRPGAYFLGVVLLVTTPLTHAFWEVKDDTIRCASRSGRAAQPLAALNHCRCCCQEPGAGVLPEGGRRPARCRPVAACRGRSTSALL